MSLQSRKGTRLKEYNYSENGAYFITICTKDKQKLFGHIVGGGKIRFIWNKFYIE
jgi:hypothetical protein